MQNDFRLRDLQFIALPAHLFDQDAEMQFTTASDQEAVGTVGFLHAEGDIRFQFFEQSLAQMARREELALAARKRAVVHGEGHLHGRLIDCHARQCHRPLGIGNGVADAHLVQSGDCDDFAGFRLLNIRPFKA